MKSHGLDVTEKYSLGEVYENNGWSRFTLFHIERNRHGGSTNWPVAEIDILEHPPKNGCNAHTEIRVSIRNDIKLSGSGIDVDRNSAKLRHPKDVLDPDIIKQLLVVLKDNEYARNPLSVYVCMRHVEDFWVEGDFWSED